MDSILKDEEYLKDILKKIQIDKEKIKKDYEKVLKKLKEYDSYKSLLKSCLENKIKFYNKILNKKNIEEYQLNKIINNQSLIIRKLLSIIHEIWEMLRYLRKEEEQEEEFEISLEDISQRLEEELTLLKNKKF